ncbi:MULTISPECIES: J domain-containing protein [unclassified Bradyrhizobium]|uniref:J domain-containing protein n=1 Tax=unclassified Bradyrhizobium TaxID=2631580 RepID=UPI0028E652B3|nr:MULTISPECIES: J domain-containing protein [unclassified Bradyrhizobium]
MKTLYDLLGALPDDDADDIRVAFRKAVKESHPDVNPGDPDAALRFRQIIRANDILGDKEQRTAYDRLLGAAQDEHRQDSKLAVVAKVHKVASGVMALAGASALALTGYLLFTHMSSASVAPLEPIVVATNKVKPNQVPARPIDSLTDTATASDAAANPGSDPAAGTTVGNGNASSSNASAPAEPLPLRVSKVDVVYSAEQERAPCAAGATAPCTADAMLAGGTASSEAQARHDRGMAAFQKGDFAAALADLDAAIQLDPRYHEAYIDRGIVFYRMRKFDRAFADVAAAKRIEKTNRAVLDAMAKRQPLRPLKLEPPKSDIKAETPKAEAPKVAAAAPMPSRMSTATPIYPTTDPSRAP